MAEDQPGVVYGDADEKSRSTAVPKLQAAKSFSELEGPDADDDTDPTEVFGEPFAVEGNDTSGFVGVSSEYRTYATDTDSPLDFDPSVADNSQEKLDALAEQAGGETDTDDSGQGSAPGESSTSKPAAKKAAPPLATKS